MVKFLILRFSSIGDIVLTTPVIRCLKEQVDDSIVHFATKEQYIPLLKTNPNIDKIHSLNNNLADLIRELKQENFDYIIDLHHNLRTCIIKSRLRIFDFSFSKLNLEKWLRVNFKVDRLPKIHIVDRYLQTLSLFDVVNDGKGLDFYIPAEEIIEINQLPPEFNDGYMAFVTGARHVTKQLPAERIIALCNLISKPVVLLGGKEDYETGETIAGAITSPVVNACGQYSINQSASLVRQARLVITHDTGLMHVAAAFKKKIISLWGNTIPEFGMYPYLPDEESQLVEVKGLPCRPCSKIGFKSCPKKHFRCMNDIDIKQVADQAIRLFNISE